MIELIFNTIRDMTKIGKPWTTVFYPDDPILTKEFKYREKIVTDERERIERARIEAEEEEAERFMKEQEERKRAQKEWEQWEKEHPNWKEDGCLF